MIFIIALILSSLVAFNFLLLIFSCNKAIKKTEEKQPELQDLLIGDRRSLLPNTPERIAP